MKRLVLILFIVAILVFRSLGTPAAAGDCLAVSAINHARPLQIVAATQHATLQQFAVQNLTTSGVGIHNQAVPLVTAHGGTHNVTFQALAIPLVPQQAFVLQQNHCLTGQRASARARAVVVQQRVRRERRGLGRLLFGR